MQANRVWLSRPAHRPHSQPPPTTPRVHACHYRPDQAQPAVVLRGRAISPKSPLVVAYSKCASIWRICRVLVPSGWLAYNTLHINANSAPAGRVVTCDLPHAVTRNRAKPLR